MLGRSAQTLACLVAPRLWRIFGWFDSSILKRQGSGGLVRSRGPKQAVADSEKPAARGSAAAAGRSGGVGRRVRGEGGPGPQLHDLDAPRQRTCLGLSGQCGVPGPGRVGRAGASGEGAGQRAWSRAPDYHARPSLGVPAHPCAWVLGGAQGGGGAPVRVPSLRRAPVSSAAALPDLRGPVAGAEGSGCPVGRSSGPCESGTTTRDLVLPRLAGSLASGLAGCLCPAPILGVAAGPAS